MLIWIFRALVVAATLGVSGCDSFGSAALSFPAEIKGITGFEGTEQTAVSDRVAKLISAVGIKFLVSGGEGGSGSSLQIRLVDELIPGTEPADASLVEYVSVVRPRGRGAAGPNLMAGRATRRGGECLIEIARFVTTYGDELLQPVLWHEIGHCAGLQHAAQPDKIMSPITFPLGHYAQANIDDFIKELQSAISQ